MKCLQAAGSMDGAWNLTSMHLAINGANTENFEEQIHSSVLSA